LSKVPLHCTKNAATEDNDPNFDGKLYYAKLICVYSIIFLCHVELICSSANHSPNFNRPTSHKTSSSLLSKRKTRIPSINSIPVSVSSMDNIHTYIYIY